MPASWVRLVNSALDASAASCVPTFSVVTGVNGGNTGSARLVKLGSGGSAAWYPQYAAVTAPTPATMPQKGPQPVTAPIVATPLIPHQMFESRVCWHFR